MDGQRMNAKITRVLFMLIQLDAGGSERVVLDLAHNLDPKKFEIFVGAFKGGVLEASFKKVCQEVFIISKKTGFDISAMLQISNIIKNEVLNMK